MDLNRIASHIAMLDSNVDIQMDVQYDVDPDTDEIGTITVTFSDKSKIIGEWKVVSGMGQELDLVSNETQYSDGDALRMLEVAAGHYWRSGKIMSLDELERRIKM